MNAYEQECVSDNRLAVNSRESRLVTTSPTLGRGYRYRILVFAGLMLFTGRAFAQCGDGNCGFSETPCTCAQDCGIPPTVEHCTQPGDQDCDGLGDFNDPDCDLGTYGACCGYTGYAGVTCLVMDWSVCPGEWQGEGTVCLGSTDGDWFDDFCDNCPNDANQDQTWTGRSPPPSKPVLEIA